MQHGGWLVNLGLCLFIRNVLMRMFLARNIILISVLLAACRSTSDSTPRAMTAMPSPTPLSEIPAQCAVSDQDYELRRTEEVSPTLPLPYEGIISPHGNWLARTNRSTLMLSKLNSELELSFALPVDEGSRAEEYLIWSPDEHYIALRYRFSLGKGSTQYYLAVYGISGAAYESLAVTLDPLPMVWTMAGLWFTRQPQRSTFTFMLWDDGALTTIAEDLTRPPFFTADAQSATVYDGHSIEWIDADNTNRLTLIEEIASLENIVWSPNGEIAAIKHATNEGESLTLAFVDGRAPIVLRTGLSGLGDPLWSPDSRMLAFTQAVNNSPVALSIVSIDGTELWNFAPVPLEWALDWFACD
jgi:hypothetical protein